MPRIPPVPLVAPCGEGLGGVARCGTAEQNGTTPPPPPPPTRAPQDHGDAGWRQARLGTDRGLQRRYLRGLGHAHAKIILPTEISMGAPCRHRKAGVRLIGRVTYPRNPNTISRWGKKRRPGLT